MPSSRKGAPGPSLHLEFFATPTSKRGLVVRRMKAVYRIAGAVTRKGGGGGPWAYLVLPKGRRRSSPGIRALFNVRPGEDLWVELAFYPSLSNLRGTLRKIWGRADFQRIVSGAESLNASRQRSSSVDLGSLRAT